MIPASVVHLRRWSSWAVKLLLAAVLLYLLVRNVSLDSILASLASAHRPALIAALLLLPLNLWLQYAKWALMLRRVYPEVRTYDIHRSLMLGFTFGLATPARIGEFGGRAVAVRSGDPLTLMGLTALDKLATMSVTLFIGCLGLLLYCFLHPFMNIGLLVLGIAAVGIAGSLGMRLLYRRRSRMVGASGFLGRIIVPARTALAALDQRTLKLVALLSILFYATFLAQFYLLLTAFGPLHPLSAIAGISTIMLIKTIVPPITLGELGVREGASVLVLGHAGILTATALSASLLLFSINLLIPALAGLPLLLRFPLKARTAA